ncbi:hypothetical protein [Phaeobacter inhibens]|uniref:hypothetical protein n=1 Tax=Phaeobacter inhibens TaxID=221822 RepID=UPI0021A498D4|nr:hypothetical protein [Phaeobacter inhibens]UWR99228.1 hypothetical protein K4L03_12535 [Phaeobacter inhibens]
MDEQKISETTSRSLDILENHIVSSTSATADAMSHLLKTLVVLNGGAVLSILAFIPAILEKVLKLPDPGAALILLTDPIIYFVVGLVFASLAIAASYYSNLSVSKFAFNNHNEILLEIEKYQPANFKLKSIVMESKGIARLLERSSRPLGVLFFLASLACFLVGFTVVKKSVVGMVNLTTLPNTSANPPLLPGPPLPKP